MKISEKIVHLRKLNGLSQEDLADKLDVSRQAISRWEMGTAKPDANNILTDQQIVWGNYRLSAAAVDSQKRGLTDVISKRLSAAERQRNLEFLCNYASAQMLITVA